MIYPTSRCHAHGDKFVGRESLALSVALTVGRLAKDGHPAFAPASVVTIDSARPDGMQPGWLLRGHQPPGQHGHPHPDRLCGDLQGHPRGRVLHVR